MFVTILGEFNLNSPIIYALYGIVVAFIVCLSLYYLITSIVRAKKIGMDMGKIKKVISSSVTFSVLPAIGIAIGVITLVGSLGIAFPAIRLSVIGSLQYETQMADGTAKALAGSMEALLAKGITKQDFITMVSVMTVSIMAGPILVLLFYKKLQPKVGMLTTKSGSVDGKVNLGELAFQVVFIGMVIGYLAMAIASFAGHTNYVEYYFNFIAVIVAALCMYIFDLLINKAHWKWLDSFATPFAMIIAMAVVAVISYFAFKNGWIDPNGTYKEYVSAVSNAVVG